MTQKVITPELKKCKCGETPELMNIIYYRSMRFECSCGNFTQKKAGNRHRAICRWNNQIEKDI